MLNNSKTDNEMNDKRKPTLVQWLKNLNKETVDKLFMGYVEITSGVFHSVVLLWALGYLCISYCK